MPSLGHRIGIDLLRSEAGDQAGFFDKRDFVAIHADLFAEALAHSFCHCHVDFVDYCLA
jgi:hypothetical protein